MQMMNLWIVIFVKLKAVIALHCFYCDTETDARLCNKNEQKVVDCKAGAELEPYIRCVQISYSKRMNGMTEYFIEKRCGLEHEELFGCDLHCGGPTYFNYTDCQSSCCKTDLCNDSSKSDQPNDQLANLTNRAVMSDVYVFLKMLPIANLFVRVFS